MTNEEAYNIISEFCFTGYENNKKPSFKLFGAIHELILDVEENTKLKDEIEKLKELTRFQQEFSVDNKTIGQLSDGEYIDFIKSILWRNYESTKEIEQLKAELEQSVKLPCKVGQIVYEIKSKFTKCTEHDCEFDDYSCQGCECLECDSKKEYYIRDIKFYSAENILVFERHFGKTIFLTREEAEQSLEGQV